MQALIEVILPVFLVIGAGYVAVWKFSFSETAIDGLMSFAQNFAIPCLLFRAMWSLDLSADFDPMLLLSYYSGSFASFAAGFFGARLLFKRSLEDAISIGFCSLFANTALLGLPIMERAYGAESLVGNFTIIALHSPVCYGLGITAMEIVRSRGEDRRKLPGKVLKAMFSNALILGISLGLFFNVFDITLPFAVQDAMNMVIAAALPVALFAVGGILTQYRPEGDMRVIVLVCTVSLVLHPLVTWTMGTVTGLGTDAFRSAVVTAAMAPGINTYLFANMYGSAKRVAASSVLIATTLSIGSIWIWLHLLP